MPITIYGIKNCDTMKKARAWLDKRGVDYAFHDYKTAGIAGERLERWEKKVGWETLLNRAGTTFRKLPDKDKAGLNAKKALALMIAAAVDDQASCIGTRRRQNAGRVRAGTLCQIGEQKRVALSLRAVAVAPWPQSAAKIGRAEPPHSTIVKPKVTVTLLPPIDHALPAKLRLFLSRGGRQNLARSSGTEFAT